MKKVIFFFFTYSVLKPLSCLLGSLTFYFLHLQSLLHMSALLHTPTEPCLTAWSLHLAPLKPTETPGCLWGGDGFPFAPSAPLFSVSPHLLSPFLRSFATPEGLFPPRT